MALDEFQQAWQSQTVETRVTINANQLLREVQRSQKNFQSMIFGRDLVEVGGSLLMIPVWFYLGAELSLPWTWYLTVPVLVWMAGFMLVHRKLRPRQPSEPGEALRHCVKESLNQVEHQIWLLRNIFWWYLLPPSISIMAFFAHVSWQASDDWWEFLGSAGCLGLGLFVVYASIYFLNQRAVRVQLEPQRQELLTLLASLSDETNGKDAHEIDIAVSVSPFAENGFIRGAGGRMTPPRPVVRVAIILGALTVGAGIFAGALAIIRHGMSEEPTTSKVDKVVQSTDPVDDSLTELVSRQREQNKLVGLATMVMVGGKVVESAVDGERKIRSGVPLEISDRWHLGGITCSITATMIAGLVESGQMQWTDTIGEIFPDAAVHEYWNPITIKQLLTNTAGAPINFSLETTQKRPALGVECTLARREAVLDMISVKPPPARGRFISAVGPTIAGAMAETVTGDTWSNLVTEIVFQPLELKGAGFGPPKSSDVLLEQPRGHRMLRGKYDAKYGVSDKTDNTPIVGPALTVHMTLHDLCTYATEHLRGYFREGKLLAAETYKVLHTPELNQYAFGWVRRKPDAEIPYTVYWHNGTNTMWYSMVAFIPEKNMVVAVTSNDGDIRTWAVAWEIVKASAKSVNLQAELPEEKDYP